VRIERFALERWITRHEMNVKYDIAESGICPLTANDLLSFEPAGRRQEILDELLNLGLGYSEAQGTLELRTLLAETYADKGPDNILVTTGAIEANFLLFNVLLEAGDHVVAPYPAYQQLYSVPRALGCEVSLWKVDPERDLRYHIDELEDLVTARTRLIVINSPHNPTGAILSADEMRRVYELAESVGATVLSDEAYRWLDIPGGDELSPPMADLCPAGISVGTVSKPFGLPGLRIGWIVASEDVVARCWGMRDYITLSPGKLNDALACLAIRHLDEIVKRNQAIITANLAAADAWIAEHADVVSWRPPRAGLLALLRYELDVPSLELADKLAEEYSVMLAPGSAFGYEHHLRIGIGQDPPVFAAGLAQASACIKELRTA
jgi:aspartate/methionine/tyrosine aminotransferase